MARENQTQIKERSGRGGKRAGAGRKPGSITKRTEAMQQAIVARIEQSGGMLDPVEAIMDIAEWSYRQWKAACNSPEAHAEAMLYGEQAVEWLAKAAPYIRPRLNAVEARVNVNVTIYDRIQRANERVPIAA